MLLHARGTEIAHVLYAGSSGQSAASFLTNGVTMNIIGDSNDGTAKGLCGGKVRPECA